MAQEIQNEDKTNNKLINMEIGSILAQKTQLLFPNCKTTQVDQFNQGDIEEAIDHFVADLQSPIHQYDLNSTILKMRRLAEDQEKKIQKSIIKDNTYSHEEAFGLSSAMKYSFSAYYPTNTADAEQGHALNQKNNIPAQQLQQQTDIQPTENKTFETPLKIISQTSKIFNSSKKINTIKSSKQIKSNSKQSSHIQSKQQSINSIPIHNQKPNQNLSNLKQTIPKAQPQLIGYPPALQQQSHNIQITNQQYINNSNKVQKYQQNGYQEQQNISFEKNENVNPSIFMSAPPAINSNYNGEMNYQIGQNVNQNNEYPIIHHYPITQQRVPISSSQNNDHSPYFSRKPMQNFHPNGYHPQQPFPNHHFQSEQFNQINNNQNINPYFSHFPIFQQPQQQSFQIQQQQPQQIQQQQLQQQQQQQQQYLQYEQGNEYQDFQLKRINSLESVQQQLNFDVKNEESILKMNFFSKIEEQDSNNIAQEKKQLDQQMQQMQNESLTTAQKNIDDFFMQQEIRCAGDDNNLNNKHNLSDEILIKEQTTHFGEADSSLEEEQSQQQIQQQQQQQQPQQYICQQQNSIPHLLLLQNIKDEGQDIDKDFRFDMQMKNNLNEFLQYELHNDLNFLMDDNHLNHNEFQQYIE